MMEKETRDKWDVIEKLAEEGFIDFRKLLGNKDDILEFISNGMCYIVMKRDGSITKYRRIQKACGKTRYEISKLTANAPTLEEQRYFKEHNIANNLFNHKCWKHLGMVFLNKKEHERILELRKQ